MKQSRRELRLTAAQENALKELSAQYAELAAYQERKDRSALGNKAADLVRLKRAAPVTRGRAALCCALCAVFVLCAGWFAAARAPRRSRPKTAEWTASALSTVPSRAALSQPDETDQPAAPPPGPLVFVNSATAQELQTLSGIGPALAERIIQERDTNGYFYLPEDLAAVLGIGSKTVEKLKPYLSFALPSAP